MNLTARPAPLSTGGVLKEQEEKFPPMELSGKGQSCVSGAAWGGEEQRAA